MKLRGAVIGCGMIAEYHLCAWNRIPEVEMVALADPDRARVCERRDSFVHGATVYPDLLSLLEKSCIDFVDILTPPWLHREHCLQAAKKSVHIICQKPLCDELEEGVSLVRELEEYPKLFCVHENHPFRPWFQEIVRLQADGFFGDALRLTLTQHAPEEPPERFKVEAERGILLDYGIHFIAMARALLGEPETVEATLARINPRVAGESKAEVVLGFSNSRAEISVSWQDRGAFSGGFHLSGSEGEAQLEGTLTRGERSRFRLSRSGEILRDEIRCPSDDFAESFFLFQKAFVDAVLHGAPLPQPADDNLKTLRCTFAAYEAAKMGAHPCP